MKRISVVNYDEELIQEYVDKISKGIYFNNFKKEILKAIILKADIVELRDEELLVKEGDETTQEMYLLIDGSLAITSRTRFVLRLDTPGDIVGEISVGDPLPCSADVIAEKKTLLFSFSKYLFEVDLKAESAPILYLLFAHVLAAKLRIATARSNIRATPISNVKIKSKAVIIDENEMDQMIIEGTIESILPNVELTIIKSVSDFIANPAKDAFDLIIIDPNYKVDSTPLEKIKHITKSLRTQNAAVYFISEYCKDSNLRSEMINLGIQELLEKPFSIYDIKHIITKFKSAMSKNKALHKIEHDAETDELTKLPNRRKLDNFLDALLEYSVENKKTFSFLMMDVDNFKHFNDTNGHQMGDIALQMMAKIFSSNVRKGDLAARFGGEEFVLVLPNCEISSALKIAENIRDKVEKKIFPNQEKQPTGNLTISIGVAAFNASNSIHDLIENADKCLYEAKKRGRNMVVQYPFN